MCSSAYTICYHSLVLEEYCYLSVTVISVSDVLEFDTLLGACVL